ncbi:hypothetical protein AB4431_20030, partial [Vibrio artabrorum]|uniref:hypothetical protein n=1 Tax=Vibrio artabrorum TaxID=446374 RepID=UPI00354E6A20
MQHSPTLMNGISDKYHDCKGGISYQYATQTRQCFRPTNNTITTTMSRVHSGYKTVTKTLRERFFMITDWLQKQRQGARLVSSTLSTETGRIAYDITYQVDESYPTTGWHHNDNEARLRTAGCLSQPAICTSGRSTRTIAGVPVTEAC